MRDAEAPPLPACAERLDALIDGESDVNVKLMAASSLLNYHNWKTHGERSATLVARIEVVLARPEITPLMAVWWRTHLSFWHYVGGRYAESARVAAEARTIAERYGLEAYLFEIDHAEASALINQGDLVAAKTRVDAMEKGLAPSRRMQWPYLHYLRSMLEQRLGHAGAATQHAELSVQQARELELPMLQMPHFLSRLGQAYAAERRFDAALDIIDEAIACASPFERRTFEQRRESFLMERDLEAGDEAAAVARLAPLLADYRARNLVLFMRQRPDLASRLLDLALSHDIETDYVRMLIERNGFTPPADASPAWPFRLRIRLLGGFELERDGLPVTFSGKAQQRPLDLLKLLVALGGSNVDAVQLTAALWPDSDGAAAKTTFDSTLFRLRKLLEVENALVLAAGRLSLDRALVWTDVRALDAAIEAALAVVPAKVGTQRRFDEPSDDTGSPR
jgi:tetratricopeptide (TPR) repeat protein